MSEQTPIAELMARDPLKLSRADRDAIIADLRASRHLFVVADDKKVGTPPARKSKAQVNREAATKLLDGGLDDLFKDL